MKHVFKGKILLITGGTGSFGNAVMRRFLNSEVSEIRIFSRDEKKQDDMRQAHKSPKLKFYLGDVRDRASIMPGRIEYDSLADHIRLGHVALLPFRPEPVTNCALPNKVLQYLACGVPTVATPLDGLMSMAGTESGVTYSRTPHQMSIDARYMLSDPQMLSDASRRGHRLVNENCNWSRQLKSFEAVLDRLIAVD